jgi:hypothetical protein
MMTHLGRSIVAVACWLLFVPAVLRAADHRLEPLSEAPPSEGVAPAIAGLFEATGFRVIRGESRTVCDVWLCKQWDVAAGERPQAVNYPFPPGGLIGIVRYPRKGSDFRDQDIPEGVYTLRYAQQPVDGAHVGTSPTRDFLLLTPVAKETSPAAPDYRTLVKQSAEAAGSSHPLLLSLQQAEGKETSPAIRHIDEPDWWIARLGGKTKTATVPIDVVVAGHAAE